jgi:hypothetical protein
MCEDFNSTLFYALYVLYILGIFSIYSSLAFSYFVKTAFLKEDPPVICNSYKESPKLTTYTVCKKC